MRKVLAIGATSAIAQATLRRFAHAGDRLFLVARDADRLAIVADDLRVRGARIAGTHCADANATAGHEALLASAVTALDGLDLLFIAHGSLGDQAAGERDFAVAEQELRTNFLSVVSLLIPAATLMESQGHGTIAVISSVAGERGRQSNYLYGAAKGALSIYLQGLRQRLAKAGVQVLTIKPGFVATPMTAHLPQNLLFVSPERVARDIDKALRQQRDTIYTPWFWRPIMAIVRAIPEPLIKKFEL